MRKAVLLLLILFFLCHISCGIGNEIINSQTKNKVIYTKIQILKDPKRLGFEQVLVNSQNDFEKLSHPLVTTKNTIFGKVFLTQSTLFQSNRQ